jgi:hypothetical protein
MFAREAERSATAPGNTPTSGVPAMADPFFTNDVLELIVHDAATTLAAIGEAQQVAVLIAWLKRPEEIAPTSSGWCELGRLAHASGRFWWTVYWHPEEARGGQPGWGTAWNPP